VDSYGPLYWSFSPHFVMFSGWVGDQNPDFEGMKDALRNMFHSSWRNYSLYGSDIGGYRDGNRTKDVLIRWAQMGALCSLMENGGDGEHRPWMYDNQTLDIYRHYVYLHYELRPYLLDAGNTAYEHNMNYSVMIPLAKKTDFHPDTWQYMLWKDLLVCPITNTDTTTQVSFPAGNDWVDWFNHSAVYQGGSTIAKFACPLEIMPIFIRKGSMLALDVENSAHNHGSEWSTDFLTVLIAGPLTDGSSDYKRVFADVGGVSQEIAYEYSEKVLDFVATAHKRPIILIVRSVTAPRRIEIGGVEVLSVDSFGNFERMSTNGWVMKSQDDLRVKITDCTRGVRVSIQF